ncbi:MAG: hypothetical protein ABI758_01290 [Candidatus Woesebacteria bacterium]
MLTAASELGITPAVTIRTSEFATRNLAENIVFQFSSDAAAYLLKQMGFTKDLQLANGQLTSELIEMLAEIAPTYEIETRSGKKDTLEEIFEGNVKSLYTFLLSGVEAAVLSLSPDEETLGYNYSLLKYYAILWGCSGMNYDSHVRRVLNTDSSLRDVFFDDPTTSFTDRTLEWLRDLMNEAAGNEILVAAIESANGIHGDIIPMLQGPVEENYSPKMSMNLSDDQRALAIEAIQKNPSLQLGVLLLTLRKPSLALLEQQILAIWDGVPVGIITQAILDSQKHDLSG